MSWLEKPFWLSLILLLITYITFGWWVAEYLPIWNEWLIEQRWFLLPEVASVIVLIILSITFIVILNLISTAPRKILEICIGSWIESNVTGFISILIWSLAFVFMLRWIAYFADYLVMLSASMLLRLELRRLGYKETITFTLLIILCLIGFAVGLLSANVWDANVWEHPVIHE